MATPDRDTVYTNDGTNRTIYSRESNSTGWFVGIIVALALLAIAYLVFSANSQPSTTTVNNTPAVTNTLPPADTTTTPMAPVDNGATMTPATPAPTAPVTAPADNGASVAPSAPAVSSAPTAASSAPASALPSSAPLASSAAQ